MTQLEFENWVLDIVDHSQDMVRGDLQGVIEAKAQQLKSEGILNG